MHDKKVLHRDLKPLNIFMTSNGLVKVGDVGVSREFSNTLSLATTHAGTMPFWSPEQVNG